MKIHGDEKPAIDELAAKAFGALVDAVPDRMPSPEEIRSVLRSAKLKYPASGSAGKGHRSAFPIAAAALALFMLLPLAPGRNGPGLAETAAAAYESGAFERYGTVFFAALTQGSVR